jgi:hypothetical protein
MLFINKLPKWYRNTIITTTGLLILGANLFTYLYFTEKSVVGNSQQKLNDFENKTEEKIDLKILKSNII